MNKNDFDLDALKAEEWEETTDFDAELVEAGWNVIRENPGIDCGDWISELLRQYPAEVVDALGTNPPEVFQTLEDWWECREYTDPETGEWRTMQQWSEFYATDPGCLQERLETANARIRELEKELEEARRKISPSEHDWTPEIYNSSSKTSIAPHGAPK